MSNLNQDLTTLISARDSMKSALENKGQAVNTDIRTYANAISNISSGGGITTILNVYGNSASVNNSTIIFTNGYYVQDDTKFGDSTFSSIPNGLIFSNVTNFYSMFYNCVNLVEVSNIDTSNGMNFRSLCSECSNLISVSNLNFTNSRTSTWVFFNCVNLNSITNVDFNMPFCTHTNSMFDNCYNLFNIPDISLVNCEYTRSMFWNCFNLTSVPNITTSNRLWYTTRMFQGCTNITTLSLFDVSGVNEAGEMFDNCFNLVSVPNFNFSTLTNLQSAFYNCYNLTTVPQFYAPNLLNIRKTFAYCNNLSNASIQNIINICLNANIPSANKNLMTNNSDSPFYKTNITNSSYSNRLSALSAAGWSYQKGDLICLVLIK